MEGRHRGQGRRRKPGTRPTRQRHGSSILLTVVALRCPGRGRPASRDGGLGGFRDGRGTLAALARQLLRPPIGIQPHLRFRLEVKTPHHRPQNLTAPSVRRGARTHCPPAPPTQARRPTSPLHCHSSHHARPHPATTTPAPATGSTPLHHPARHTPVHTPRRAPAPHTPARLASARAVRPTPGQGGFTPRPAAAGWVGLRRTGYRNGHARSLRTRCGLQAIRFNERNRPPLTHQPPTRSSPTDSTRTVSSYDGFGAYEPTKSSA